MKNLLDPDQSCKFRLSPQSRPASLPPLLAVMSGRHQPRPLTLTCLCRDPRPVSLISTLSSGSRDDSLAPRPSSQTSDISPDLSPARHGGEESRPCPPCHSKGWSLGLTQNNNNKALTASRASRTGSMTPNPKLTYLDRVVMEIIETERMYVRDLRMIVEVTSSALCIFHFS